MREYYCDRRMNRANRLRSLTRLKAGFGMTTI